MLVDGETFCHMIICMTYLFYGLQLWQKVVHRTPLKIETLQMQKIVNYENLHNSLVRETIEMNT